MKNFLIALFATGFMFSAQEQPKAVGEQSQSLNFTPIDLGAPTCCTGCGCRGGPGWRSKRTGQCVGWDDLTRECGNPPNSDRCTKEN
jgi:hypothetical protein